jgi:NADH dehydrogenase FAD-containing subunit
MIHGIKKLVLLGAGHAHIHVLTRLARNRPAGLDITVVSPYPVHTYSGMVPGLVAGHYSAEACQIPLQALAKAAGAKWLQAGCTGIDCAEQRLRLSPTGKSLSQSDILPPDLPYHLLSIAVIGAGAAGIELLFAAEQCLRLQGVTGARFTLVAGGDEVAANYPPGVRKRVLRQLKRRGITVLRESCVGMEKGRIQLASGAQLACDVPLLAIGGHAPAWLQDSGLALSDTGHVLVNQFQQSPSHPNVFAAGDVATRVDKPHPQSGVCAVRAGPPLAHNLLAQHEGLALKPHHPPANTLNLLSCGTGHGIAAWGPLHAEGAWAWRWKDRMDRAFMAKYPAAAVN